MVEYFNRAPISWLNINQFNHALTSTNVAKLIHKLNNALRALVKFYP